MIVTKKLNFSYTRESHKKHVLKNIDLTISKGDFVAVLGQNGSGKSTLAKHFNAILLPESGSVFVTDFDTSNKNYTWEIRKNCAMVFQNPDNQIVATIVEEDVAFAAENLGLPPSEIRARVDEALKIVGMSEFKSYAPHLLSGGQKQRIAIAAAIAMRPEIIVFDEPTAMLDPQGRKEVMKCITELNNNYNITIVIITHNMDEAVQAKRVVVIDDGEIVLDDTPREVFSDIERIEKLGLDVPQVTRLVAGLRKKGLMISENILTVEECIGEIERICQSK